MPPYTMATARKVTRFNSILAHTREHPTPAQWAHLDFSNAFVDRDTGGLKVHGGTAGWVLLLPKLVEAIVKGAERRAALDHVYGRWQWVVTKQPKHVRAEEKKRARARKKRKKS